MWRQDHNGFSHQDPGFIDHVANKRSDTMRIYLPPDANTLLCVTDQRLRTTNFVNLIIPRVKDAEQRRSEVLQRHKRYVSEHGEDMPEVRDWKWVGR